MTVSGHQDGVFELACNSSLDVLAVEFLPKEKKLSLGLGAIFIMVPTIVLNGLVIAVLLRTRKLHTTSNVFLGGLATTDLITALVLMPSFASMYLLSTPRDHCILVNVTSMCALAMFLATFISMLLIAIDRYIAIVHPFHYHKLSAYHSRLMYVVASQLLFSIAISLASLFTPNRILFYIVGILLLSVTLTWSVYVHIRSYQISRQIRTRDRELNRVQRVDQSRDRNSRIGRMVATMLGALCICLFPFLGGLALVSLRRNDSLTKNFYPVSLLIFMSNSLLNPLIYCWKMQEIRKAINNLVRAPVTVDPSTNTSSNGKQLA